MVATAESLGVVPAPPRSAIYVVDVEADGRFRPAKAVWNIAAPCADAAAIDGSASPERFGAEMSIAAARYEECVATRRPVVFDARCGERASESRWRLILTPVSDGGQRVRQIVVVALDLTHGGEVADRLVEAERQFSGIVGNLPGIVYRRVMHPDGRISYPYVSRGIKDLFGYTVEQVMCDPELMSRTIDPRDLPSFRQAVARSAEDGSSYELELRSITADGDVRWVRSTAQTARFPDGRIVWDGVILDISDLKQAEAQAAAREAELRDFAEAASDWLWETDEHHRFTRMSERLVDACGIDPASFIGRTRQEMSAGVVDADGWRELLRLMERREPYREFMFRWRLPDGSIRHLKISGKPVFDERGAFRGYRGTGTDLTAQRNAEERAAAASSRLLIAVEALSEAVAIFNADDRLVLCNERYRRLYGDFSDRLIEGAPFAELLRAIVLSGRLAAASADPESWLARRLERHQRTPGSFEELTSEGRWLQVSEQTMPDGGTVILATDITDVKRRVEALTILTAADQRATFFGDVARSLVAGIGYRWAGVARLSDDGSRAETLAWFDRDVPQPDIAYELSGTPCGDVIAANGFLALDDDLQVRYPDDKWLASIGARSYVGEVVRGIDGRPIGHVFGIDDTSNPGAQTKRFITSVIAARVGFELHRLEAEAQLRAAKEAAELASRTKTQFLANMSHELRTPLNAIIGFSQMIRDEFRGPVGRPEYKDYANDIHDSSCHLLQIINDILDVSKIEAGMLTLHEGEVDIGQVVGDCRRLVQRRADEARVALVVDVPQPAPILRADERLLRQILLNLLSNAVKFTTADGSVAVTVTVTPADELVLSVRDTGIGIAPENFEKVMQPFGQIDGALARRYEGTGLGLPLTKALVRLHGGTLTLASEIGVGTTVSVQIPDRLVGKSWAARGHEVPG